MVKAHLKYILQGIRKRKRYFVLNFILFLLLILQLGCNPIISTQNYINPETGVSLIMPETWNAYYSTRNGRITLTTESGYINKDKARIEILTSSCLSNLNNSPIIEKTSVEMLKQDINRIKKLYNMDYIAILKEPTIEEIEKNEIAKAIILVPTISMQNDMNRIQIGKPERNKYQIIEVNSFLKTDTQVITYLYRGNNEELNLQGQKIIDSIQIDCSKFEY